MSFNGSGTFLINSSGQPVVTGTTISATVFNAFTADIATGLSTCLTKDGQTTPTANIGLGGFKLTNVGAATARTDAASLANIQDGTGVYVSSVGGTADVITLTPSPVITSYAAGQCFWFIASGANTGAVTVNVNSLGAKAVTKNGTTALAANDIASGALVGVRYDGTRFQIVSINTLLSGNTFGGNLTVTGTCSITGATTFTANATLTRAEVGGDVTLTATNSDNTNTASHSVVQVTVGGTSGGDPKTVYTVTSGSTWSVAIDNSDSDTFKIGSSSAVGTNTAISITTALNTIFYGSATVTGNNKAINIVSSGSTAQLALINTGTSGRVWSVNSTDTTGNFLVYDDTAAAGRFVITSTGAVTTGGQAAATGYNNAGDITLPATGAVRAQNTFKAWVQFDASGGTPSISDSFNVTSITDNGVGDYTINMTNALTNANYVPLGLVKNSNDATTSYLIYESSQTSRTTSLFRIRTFNAGGGFVDAMVGVGAVGE